MMWFAVVFAAYVIHTAASSPAGPGCFNDALLQHLSTHDGGSACSDLSSHGNHAGDIIKSLPKSIGPCSPARLYSAVSRFNRICSLLRLRF
jgi:hypothetical protein